MSTFTLRVIHPDIDPRKITEELGLPPQTSWRAGGETGWQTRLAGDESGRGDVNSALRDIAARFAHYRFFVDEMQNGGGRVEVIAEHAAGNVDTDVRAAFGELGILLTVMSA
jgi:hypothetical protein